MSRSNKRNKKKIKRGGNPQEKAIGQGKNPDQYYDENPRWNFKSCDKEKWSLISGCLNAEDYVDLFSKLGDFEKMTWHDILLSCQDNNHPIPISKLNKCAQKRLIELKLEDLDEVVSLRLSGRVRLYGFINLSIYNVLWLDKEHGDNGSCVCRSRLKHT